MTCDQRLKILNNASGFNAQNGIRLTAWEDGLGSGDAIDATATTSLYDKMKTAVEGQATLEKNWVNGWTDVYYWYQVY